MKKMSIIMCRILILLLILTISLCSCAQITDILDQLNGNQSASGNTDNSGHHTHSYAKEVTDPTCTSEGYTTYTCACGDSYVDDKVPALSHNYNAVVTLPTCTTEGYTTYTCSCGDSYTADKTAALGHNYKAGVNLIPTCTDKGAVLYICQNNESHKYTEEIPANGHIDVDPKDFTCDVCDTDLCIDHIEQILGGKSPTCTETGLTEGKQCSICGEILLAQSIIPANGHKYNTVVTAPTCTCEGYTTYTCACGDSYVANEVLALSHNYKAVVTAPTCTSEGYTTYTCACGDSYVADKTSSTNHNYNNGKCTVCGSKDPNFSDNGTTDTESFDYSKVPDYSGNNYVEINGNEPYFTTDQITSNSFESYSELDSLGRVGTAFACLGTETLPTGNRGSLSYNPTGWVQKSYPSSVVPQTQIYNRSHLIAWSLSGEDNNKQNLMTGTPYFNQIGMQIFENMVLDYIRETDNHVMYRVTPVFVGDNLLANGVLMEAWSVEDNGDGICFCVFMYNVQPGITIDYATGENFQTPSEDNDSKQKTATLVTDISDIKAGDKIIIVAANANYALGGISSSKNNRVACDITKDGNVVYFGDDVEIITLGQGKTNGTFAFTVDGGYLYAASSSSNHLKTGATLTDNGSWKIEIASNGVATIKSTGTHTRNWLRFNSQNVIFSAYGSGQNDVCIYIVND